MGSLQASPITLNSPTSFPPTEILCGGFMVPSCTAESQGYLVDAKELRRNFQPPHGAREHMGRLVHGCKVEFALGDPYSSRLALPTIQAWTTSNAACQFLPLCVLAPVCCP
jgi:hypothetical protein